MTEPTDEDFKHARVLWDYHRLDDPLVPSDVIIGLGSHDVSVAERAAQLWRERLAPIIVFSGANSPTTIDRFPRGEAVHYRERAMELGVPEDVILVEPRAKNTAENIDFTKSLLLMRRRPVASALIVARPYQQRRARATFRQRWPGLAGAYTSAPFEFDDYLSVIGDAEKVLNMLVGDTQRIGLYAIRGFSAPDRMPQSVHVAFSQLVQAGYVSRIID